MTRGLAPILAILVCSVSHQAFAQEKAPGRYEGVRDRARPEYDALGGRFGSFLVFPKITAGVAYDDNIFATENNTESDTIFSIEPSVSIESQWARHALNLRGNYERDEYSNNNDESYSNYSAAADGRIDVTRDATLKGAASYARITEPRTALSAFQGLSRSVRYDYTDWSVGGAKRFNRIRVNLDYEQEKYSYDDTRDNLGNVISQNYRDLTSSAVTARFDYSLSPATFVFLKGVYHKDDYKLEPPFVTDSKDSDGYEVTAGADFDISNLLRGQIEAGYMTQDYDSPVFGSFNGAQVRGKIEYYPTQLTTLTLTGERTVRGSGDINTAGYLSTAVALQVDHELLRNVILTARGDYEHADFSGIDRNDNRYAVSLGGTYLLNRNVGVSLTYYYLKQRSGGLDRGNAFEDNRLMATTTLQY